MSGRAKRDEHDVEACPTSPPSTPPSRVRKRRAARPREVQARTIHPRRMSKRDMMIGAALYPDDENDERPRTRADCENVPRPCPFVSCRHHVYLDVSARTGGLKLNFPDLEPDELEESCSLDVAEQDGVTLERVGQVMNLTRERVRQIEASALAKYKAIAETYLLRGAVHPKRRLPILG